MAVVAVAAPGLTLVSKMEHPEELAETVLNGALKGPGEVAVAVADRTQEILAAGPMVVFTEAVAVGPDLVWAQRAPEGLVGKVLSE